MKKRSAKERARLDRRNEQARLRRKMARIGELLGAHRLLDAVLKQPGFKQLWARSVASKD